VIGPLTLTTAWCRPTVRGLAQVYSIHPAIWEVAGNWVVV